MESLQVMQGPAAVPSGTILQLSDAQASVRRAQIRELAGGWFMAFADLIFATGEVVTFCTALDEKTQSAFTPPEMKAPSRPLPCTEEG